MNELEIFTSGKNGLVTWKQIPPGDAMARTTHILEIISKALQRERRRREQGKDQVGIEIHQANRCHLNAAAKITN